MRIKRSIEFFVSYKDFRAADYININRELGLINWSKEFSNCDCDTIAEKIYPIINNLINKCVPTKHSFISSNFPEWFGKQLREPIRNRTKPIGFTNYLRIKMTTSSLSEFVRFVFVNVKNALLNILEKLKTPLFIMFKSFWSFVMSKKKSFGIPNPVFLNNIEATDGREISKLFALHFRTPFTESNPDLPVLNDSPTLCDSLWITEGELRQAMLAMNVDSLLARTWSWFHSY